MSDKTNPHIADNRQMPKARKEVFLACATEITHIIIFLLVVTRFLTTNIWHGGVDAALVGAIMSTHLKIKELAMTA